MAPNETLALRKELLEDFLERECDDLYARDPSYLSPSILAVKLENAWLAGWSERDRVKDIER